MRRVILFVLVVALSLGTLVGAGAVMFSKEDKIEAREETLFGDPSAADGLLIETDLISPRSMVGWHTAMSYENGDISIDSRLLYRPEPAQSDYYSQKTADLSLVDWYMETRTLGQGVANIEDIALNGHLSNNGNAILQRLVREVAQRVQPGYRRTETFRLSDYRNQFDWSLTAVLGMGAIQISEADISKLNRAFKVSTEGFFLSVSVDRDISGLYVGVSVYLTSEEREPQDIPLSEVNRALGSSYSEVELFDPSRAVMDERGIWVVPSVTDKDGRELVEAVDGPGVYFIPLLRTEDPHTETHADIDHMRLFYPTSGKIVEMALRWYGDDLELLEEREDGLYLTILNARTGELTKTIKLFDGGEYLRCVERESMCLFTLTDGSFALMTYWDVEPELAMTGRLDPNVTFEVNGVEKGLFELIGRDASIAFDGERLILLHLPFTFQEGQFAFLSVLDGTGLSYVGAFFLPAGFKYNIYDGSRYVMLKLNCFSY